MPFLTGLSGNLEFLHHPEISMSGLLSGCFWGSRNWHCAMKDIAAGGEVPAQPHNAADIVAVQRSPQGIYWRDLKIFFPPPPYISHRLASMQTK
jgi:hypothetical protein